VVAPAEVASLLEVRDLQAAFFTRRGIVRAVDGVSFALRPGQTLGLVGESGCGKTATAMSILRMLPFPGRVTGGQILFQGEDLVARPERAMDRVRGRQIALIPQDPTSSLNPLLTVGDHLVEVLEVHLGLHGAAARARAVELLHKVGIPEPERRFRAYPFQLSGGMRQRVMIAMAIACRPPLLIADEPTTALDATVQAQVLELIQSLGRELDTATILITHNLGIVAGLCDWVAVMYAGRIVEIAPRDELFARPRHPYTVGLLRCVPRLDRVGVAELESIPGRPPDLIRPGWGCAFAPRCAFATSVCLEEAPPLAGDDHHRAACWHQEKVASGV
jgi:oligopeptide/dipeptide ABC transporter ATP-binding protein